MEKNPGAEQQVFLEEIRNGRKLQTPLEEVSRSNLTNTENKVKIGEGEGLPPTIQLVSGLAETGTQSHHPSIQHRWVTKDWV